MKSRFPLSRFTKEPFRSAIAVLCVFVLTPGNSALYAQQPAAQEQPAPKIPADQLDSLVAPIALYPDPLLSQTLVASTYPLELIQMQQWRETHKTLKGDALADAVSKESWDPSIQAMASFPDVTKRLAGDIKWTTELGNAFLAQQGDVMDAVQRMRAKAAAAGNLKSTSQMKVETKVVETKTVIVIEQADPKVVYVPFYNPVVIYGAPVYPYPVIYYPPPTAAVLAFGAGIALGAAWRGGWGYGCGWGHNDVNININNHYVSNRTNINNTNINRTNINNSNINRANINNSNINRSAGNTNWQHNPQHRGAAPYSNSVTANKYAAVNRPNGGTGASGEVGNKAANRPAGGGAGESGARASTMPASTGNRVSGSSTDRIGGRSPSPGGGGSAFGGGMGGSSAKSASSRGAQSLRGGGSRGGGARRGR